MGSEHPKIGLLGASLGTGNQGVSALGTSLVKIIGEVLPGAEPFLLIGNRDSRPFEIVVNGVNKLVPVVNYRLSPKAAPNVHLLWILLMALAYRCLPLAGWRRAIAASTPWIGAVAGADFVGEMRGGDSFSDIYGLREFVLGTLPIITCILVRRKVALLPQTYGPFRSPVAKPMARYVLQHADPILSRDPQGREAVKELLGEDRDVRFCPDVAFALEARMPAQLVTEPSLDGLDSEGLIGLNVNGLMYRGGFTKDNMFGLKLDYPRFLVQLADKLLADPSRHLLLVPHAFAAPDHVESDPAACQEVRQQLTPELRKRAHLVLGNYDQCEIKGVIGLCDFFIGSRMHACIAALSQGIPTVGVAYSKKFSGVFETVGAGQAVIDGRDCTVEQALQKTVAIFESRESMRRGLKASVKQAQEKLYAIFDQMLGTGHE